LHYLAIELLYFEYNLWKTLLIWAWWKLKVAQFWKTIFMTTFFDHLNMFSPSKQWSNSKLNNTFSPLMLDQKSICTLPTKHLCNSKVVTLLPKINFISIHILWQFQKHLSTSWKGWQDNYTKGNFDHAYKVHTRWCAKMHIIRKMWKCSMVYKTSSTRNLKKKTRYILAT
jgi:hypothetical protein